MGLPNERRVLYRDRLFTEAEWCQYLKHPSVSGTFIANAIPLDVDRDLRVCGHDGATSERYPAVPVGHMREM